MKTKWKLTLVIAVIGLILTTPVWAQGRRIYYNGFDHPIRAINYESPNPESGERGYTLSFDLSPKMYQAWLLMGTSNHIYRLVISAPGISCSLEVETPGDFADQVLNGPDTRIEILPYPPVPGNCVIVGR